MVRKMFAVAMFAGVFTVLGGLVSAHHSTAGYDNKTTTETKGTVVEFRWRNPHVMLIWDAKDATGKDTRWTGEMQSPLSSTADGLTRNSIKAGDELAVAIHPGPNGQALVVSIVDAHGKSLITSRARGEAP